MSNPIEEEFKSLMNFMFDGKNISDIQRENMERAFYAGAFSVNISILKGQGTEKEIGELFDFIKNKCEELGE